MTAQHWAAIALLTALALVIISRIQSAYLAHLIDTGPPPTRETLRALRRHRTLSYALHALTIVTGTCALTAAGAIWFGPSPALAGLAAVVAAGLALEPIAGHSRWRRKGQP